MLKNRYAILFFSIFLFSACQSNMIMIGDKYNYGSGAKRVNFDYGDESFRAQILVFENEGSAWVKRIRNPFALQMFDDVYMYQTEEELTDLIKFWKPDVRILGEDYIGKSFTGDDLPPQIIYTTRSHEWSTTRLKDLITKQTIEQNPDILK